MNREHNKLNKNNKQKGESIKNESPNPNKSSSTINKNYKKNINQVFYSPKKLNDSIKTNMKSKNTIDNKKKQGSDIKIEDHFSVNYCIRIHSK